MQNNKPCLMEQIKPIQNTQSKLLGIQALRGLAAMSVLVYHTARHLAQATNIDTIKTITQPGHAGVDLFFVLSGFIILYVHRNDIGKPQAIGRYVRQRFIRLMPIYWIALAITMVLLSFSHAEKITAKSVFSSVTLLPVPTDPLLGVAWTLQHEIIFYAFFTILIYNRKIALTFFSFWSLVVAINTADLLSSHISLSLGRFTSLFNLQFLFGMASATAVTSNRIRNPKIITFTGIITLLSTGALEALDHLDGYGTYARFAYGISCALLIAGLAAWELKAPYRVNSALVYLGEASYSLYLFHLIGIAVAWQIWLISGIDTAKHALFCFLLLLTSATICGLCAHYFIEVPLLNRIRQNIPLQKSGIHKLR